MSQPIHIVRIRESLSKKPININFFAIQKYPALTEFQSLVKGLGGDCERHYKFGIQLSAEEAVSPIVHTPQCGGGRKPHGVHTLVRGRATSLVMKGFCLIPNGFRLVCGSDHISQYPMISYTNRLSYSSGWSLCTCMFSEKMILST